MYNISSSVCWDGWFNCLTIYQRTKSFRLPGFETLIPVEMTVLFLIEVSINPAAIIQYTVNIIHVIHVIPVYVGFGDFGRPRQY